MDLFAKELPTRKPGKRSALRDDIYVQILDRLLGGMYSPGDPLTIDQLAREFEVSQTPIREALVELEKTGLVERAARRGYRAAAPLTSKQMEDLVEVRILLETAAARKAFECRELLVPELREALQKQQAAVSFLEASEGPFELSQLRSYFEADWTFHEVILRHSGNPYLRSSVDALSFQVHRMRQTLGTGSSDGPDALREHAEIVRAYQEKDEGAVVEALSAHLGKVLERSLSGR